jgi:threonine 3-dehydrogenase
VELMQAERNKLTVETSYNLAGMSFTPEEIAENIRAYIPDFQIAYKPDFRQKIAMSWPNSIDDSSAQKDWKWKVAYNLKRMTDEMICHISEQLLVKSA